MKRWGILWSLGLCLVLVATNRYEGPPTSENFVPGDSYSYLTLALSAPGLPQETLHFHHSQRIAIPYLLGLLHLAVPIPIHGLFQLAVVVIALATLLIVAGLLEALSLHRRQAALVLAVLALNPWAFRPYFTFPEMVNDLGFVLGLSVMLRGLVLGKGAEVLLGQIVASLSRQTGLLLVPVAAVWLWRDRETWGPTRASRRMVLGLAAGALAGGIYLGTARLAAGFSLPNENAEHLLGMAHWLTTQFNALVLADFLLRALMPTLIPVALLLGIGADKTRSGRGSNAVPMLLFASLCIWAQPMLGGPDMIGGTVIRLVAIGLLPLCLALAIRLRDAGAFAERNSRWHLAWVGVLVALASLHHWYVFTSAPSIWHKGLFATAYVLAVAGCFVATGLDARDRRGSADNTIGAAWTPSSPRSPVS